MLQKRKLPDGKVEVTFRMPPLDGVVELALRGDFNGWDAKGVPLRLESDGTWVATLVLDEGRAYRFRYFDNQGTWHNDWEADAYVPNNYGSDDSIVDLTKGASVAKRRGRPRTGGTPRATSKGRSGHMDRSVAPGHREAARQAPR